eukprot:SAG31_NODE_39937_length_284_cov_0.945946_1_plen_62_part_10
MQRTERMGLEHALELVERKFAFSKVLHSRLGADSPAVDIPAENVWDILYAIVCHGGKRLAIG